jgi:transposase-like protein
MPRPSKLTPDQWREIERRLNVGDSASELAREFGVHPAQITRRITQVSQNVRNVAKSLASAQNALAELPVAQQYAAVGLAEKLRGISHSLASAAELGAKTAHRLHSLANSEVNKVDDADPLASIESLKGVGILTKLANDSSQIAVNLLSANKEAMKPAETDDVAGALAELADRLPT